MELTRNKVKSIIRKSFTKRLVDFGFIRLKNSLGGYRIHGDFVDVVSIQIGRNPGSLYLHYFTNLLVDPFGDLLNENIVGTRLSGNPDDVSWITEEEENVYLILDDMWKKVESIAFPFFDDIGDISRYIAPLEAVSLDHPYPFSLSVLYAIKGAAKKSKKLISRIKEELQSDDNFDLTNDDEDAKLLSDLNALEKAINENTVTELTDKWRTENLAMLSPKK